MDVDTNASMVYGSGNVGRPQFATFNRTGTTRTRSNDNQSEYNALQMKVDRRFRNGFLIMNSYTLSRSRDLANENTSIGTPIDFDLSWSRSNFDRTHNYVLTSDLRAALGTGQALDEREHARQDRRRLAAERPLHRAVGHSRSTLAATAHCSTHQATAPSSTSTASNTVLGGLGPGQLYFDPSVYSLPAAGVQGNMKRNSGPDGPGFWQLDMSLFKRFSVGGTRFAEFRIDAFNATNSVRWGNPTTGYSVATGNTFGQITGTNGSQRQIRFGGRFVF